MEYSAIAAPDNAPSWAYDRHALGNAVEASEHRINSRVAREFEIMVPRESSAQQCVALVHAYVQAHCVDQGMVADSYRHPPPGRLGRQRAAACARTPDHPQYFT